MKYLATICMLFFLPLSILAQVSIVSTTPINNAINVSTTTTITITFNTALDTAAMGQLKNGVLSNIQDSTVKPYFSSDAKTFIAADVHLETNTAYYIMFLYAKGMDGSTMTSPYVFYFTTGSTFPSTSVSGTVSSQITGVTPHNAVVGISLTNLQNNNSDHGPNFAMMATVNDNGTFTIPYVSNGTYFPAAAEDVDGNGSIDPGKGPDVVAFGDSFVVNNSSINGLSLIFAPLSIVSTVPANGAKNVPLTTTITITFSEPVDTSTMNQMKDAVFSNIQDSTTQPYYSADGKTFIASNVHLNSNTAYFVLFSFAKGWDGSKLASPYVFYFTTGSSFPSDSVSGTVVSGSTGVSPQNAFVGLANSNPRTSKNNNGPDFAMTAIVHDDGTFTIPYVSNGTYFPLAAKDVDNDGMFNVQNGVDVVAFGDSIQVNNSPVTGITLTFIQFTPFDFTDALKVADSMFVNIPSDCVLKRVNCWNTDSLGRGQSWSFDYLNSAAGYEIRVDPFESQVNPLDSTQTEGLSHMKTLLNPGSAASSAAVIAAVEAAGGYAFRTQQNQGGLMFQGEMLLGDLNWTQYNFMPHDTSKLYWAVTYAFGYYTNQNNNWYSVSQEYFLCDFNTGAVVASVTGVKTPAATAPTQYSLQQNYPNPFNPTTTIDYTLAKTGFVSIKIYNILGQLVRTLVEANQTQGLHSIVWDGRNDAGIALPSGIFFLQMQSGAFSQVRKLVLMK